MFQNNFSEFFYQENIERIWYDIRNVIPCYGISENHYKHYFIELLFNNIYSFERRIEAFFDIMKKMYPNNNEE